MVSKIDSWLNWLQIQGMARIRPVMTVFGVLCGAGLLIWVGARMVIAIVAMGVLK